MLEAQLKKVMTRKNPPSPEYKKEGKEADEEEQERLRRIAKAVSLVHEGHVRRAVQSLTRKGLAMMDEGRMEKMRKLHPDGGNAQLPGLPDGPQQICRWTKRTWQR